MGGHTWGEEGATERGRKRERERGERKEGEKANRGGIVGKGMSEVREEYRVNSIKIHYVHNKMHAIHVYHICILYTIKCMLAFCLKSLQEKISKNKQSPLRKSALYFIRGG